MALMQGLASIALLPSGSLSGHFIDAATHQCYGLFGTEIPCERECSRAEDYRLVNLTVLNFKERKEYEVIVEFRGEDAARFRNADDVHGWEEHVIEAQKKQRKDSNLQVSFECSTLKSDAAAEAHIRRYIPALANRGAVVNIGCMVIRGLDSTPRTPFPEKNEGKGPAQQESKSVKDEKESKRPAQVKCESFMDSDVSEANEKILSRLLQEELQAEEILQDAVMKGLVCDGVATQVALELVKTERDDEDERP